MFRLLALSALIISAGCRAPLTPPADPETTLRLETGPGPEDMVLDTLHGPARLLVSCTSRREGQPEYGEIESLLLPTGKRRTLVRTGEPDSLRFRPHGIFLDGDRLLVISHEREPDDHPILVYRLRGDTLEFREAIRTAGQNSPNAVVSGREGEIFLVNDAGKRGSMAERIFRLKRASVVRLTKEEDGTWTPRFEVLGLGYPAGINRIGNRLYVGDALLHQVHVYGISDRGLSELPPIGRLKGNDNLRLYQGDQLLTVCHTRALKLVGHARKASNRSPVEVFRMNARSGNIESIFRTDGSLISAGSTAIIHEDYLYISQIFEPFILRVELTGFDR